MEFINNFKEYLLANKASAVTSRNYISDIKYFINWYENKYQSSFAPENLTRNLIDEFTKGNSERLARSSIQRHLSTLRKFSSYLMAENQLTANPFDKSGDAKKQDKWELGKIRDFLHVQGASRLSIKNYVNDIRQFLDWADKVIPPEVEWQAEKDIYKKLNSDIIDEYKNRLISLNFSPLSVNRKLSSLRKLMQWAHEQGKIPQFPSSKPEFPESAKGFSMRLRSGMEVNQEEIIGKTQGKFSRFAPLRLIQKTFRGLDSVFEAAIVEPIANATTAGKRVLNLEKNENIFKPDVEKIPQIQDPLKISNLSKSFYDPLNVSTKNMPFFRKIIYSVRFNRPKWYLKYHNYSIVHYIHLGILIIFMSILGFSIYQKFWGKNTQVLGTSASFPSRVITLKQSLKSEDGAAITSPSRVRFAIYDDAKASGSALLWEEVNTVYPDKSGEFVQTIGQNNQIPPNLFLSYPSLWLGVTLTDGPELRPRKQLSQIALSDNASNIAGMSIADDENYTNAILALDSTGNINLGGNIPHSIQSLGGELTVTGNVLNLTTVPGTSSNIQIMPDGLGKIDFQKPIQNTSNSNNVLSAIGSVEFDDNVSILATTSAQSALTIYQDGFGPLISASSGGRTVFRVDNLGNTLFDGNLTLSGVIPSIISEIPDTFLSIGTTGKGQLVLQPTSLGDIEFFSPLNSVSASGTLKLAGDIVLATSSATTFGGIKYSWPTADQGNNYFLRTDGSGKLSWKPIPDLTSIWNQWGTNVGLGTTEPNFRLDVRDAKDSTSSAQIFNTSTSLSSSGLVVKLGNTNANTDIGNKWITFEQSGIGIVGLIKGNGSTGVVYQTDGVADFAEYLRKSPSEEILFGSLVCLESDGLVHSCDRGKTNIIGVSSEHPAFLGGKDMGSGSVPVGMVGQVKTWVSNIKGDIKSGDPLTYSEIPGVAVKAIDEGKIVGRALSDFASQDCPFDPSQNFGLIDNNNICKGKIYVYLNVSHYKPDFLAQSGKLGTLVLKQTQDGYYQALDSLGNAVEKVDIFDKALIANLTAGLINAREIIADSIDVNSLKISGQDIRDYISSVVNQTQSESLISNSSTSNEIKTNIISPLSENQNIAVKLPDNRSFEIQDSSGSAVASISASGNASFSGSLSANSVNTQNINSEDASVSGTLRAGRIIADEILGQYRDQAEKDFLDIASVSSQLVYVDNLRARTGNFVDGLISQSPSTFSDISVFGQVKVEDNLILSGNSLNTFDTDLEIQPLRQGGLSLMAGLIYIDREGNAKFSGDAVFAKNVSVHGNLYANFISPLPDQDLTFDIASGSSSLVVRKGTESAVFALSQNGDLASSGSGTFNKLNLFLVKPAQALSRTEAIATGSAGVATISAYQREMTIRNNLVTDKSLILITPREDTGNVVLYLLRQIPQTSFTVGINTILSKPASFNWLIIN